MANQIEPPLPAQPWTATYVKEGKTEENPRGGTLQKFYLDFEGSVDGFNAEDVYWRRKEGNAPVVGQSYVGSISIGDYGYRFKSEPGAGTAAPRGSVNTGSAGTSSKGWQPESERDPERSARILRQHSQEMAVRTLTALGSFQGKSAEMLRGTLKTWTDFYDKDVIETSQGAPRGAADPKPPPTIPAVDAAPAQPPPGDDHYWLCKQLEKQAVGSYPATKLADFIVDRFTPEQILKARHGLGDHERAADTLAKLKTAYENAAGEPLPTDDVADDIPF